MIATRVPRGTQRAKTATIPAPVKGWNARDALGEMDPLDAVSLTNMFPATTSVNVRGGYTQHVTGITGQVETLMAYSSGSANKLFGAAGTDVYDVTSAGAVGAASLSSLSNARWQYVNFTTTGGSYLCMVNGADVYRVYTGSAWQKDGDGAPYDITGVTSSNLTNITVFKNRIWFTEKQNLKAWYLAANAIGGAATALNMSSVAQKGGYLMAAATWTLDGGYGVDDYLVFITSNGELMLWRLTDPSTPTGIALVGVWEIGSPIGRRCFLKYGGDLLVITQNGVLAMSAELQGSTINMVHRSVTDKIQNAMSIAAGTYSANYGWQLFQFPNKNVTWVNIPIAEGSAQQQYVQNNITKAWCNFTGWSANCWELYADAPYFGGNGFVGKAWTGSTDNNAQISGSALQSFQDYGTADQKQCVMIRYHFLTDGTPTINGDVNVDYDINDNVAQLSMPSPANALWGTAVWDGADWGSRLAPFAEWQGATGIGYTFAPFLKVAANNIQLQWTSTDLVFQRGGAL